ncbi:MAG: bifunctional 5,10-methylenetetrahydrofolate dehydrogenase/5,10-methenyltetrahydrofolate cyclohydrolase [Candidatus Omnitrophica bacterium]|nr:bifunctional 5,10-methylenetetrahydrofolate dehydrogenase/5,10-methenyltetrahydrofolate cyclohydrolase [Candidatus Omnitrophota bacterium]
MSAVVLNGKDVARKIRQELQDEIATETRRRGIPPKLLLFRVGEAEDACLYEQSITRLSDRFGFVVEKSVHSGADSPGQIRFNLKEVAGRADVDGILVLSPFPSGHDYHECVRSLPVSKDAEGTRYSPGAATVEVYPPTAMAVMEMVLASNIQVEGLHAVVVGRSPIVGRPAADLLLKHNATVTVCHSRTRNLEDFVASADILVAATGKPGLIKGAWIKPGAVCVDAGETVVNGAPAGDIDFNAALERAGFLTPVPSGVGPVTPLMLVRNLLTLSRGSSGS